MKKFLILIKNKLSSSIDDKTKCILSMCAAGFAAGAISFVLLGYILISDFHPFTEWVDALVVFLGGLWLGSFCGGVSGLAFWTFEYM